MFGVDWVQAAAFVFTASQVIGAIIAIPVFIFVLYRFFTMRRP